MIRSMNVRYRVALGTSHKTLFTRQPGRPYVVPCPGCGARTHSLGFSPERMRCSQCGLAFDSYLEHNGPRCLAQAGPVPSGFRDLSLGPRLRHVRYVGNNPLLGLPLVVPGLVVLTRVTIDMFIEPTLLGIPILVVAVLTSMAGFFLLMPSHLWTDGPELVKSFNAGPFQLQRRVQFGGIEWTDVHDVVISEDHEPRRTMPGLVMRVRGGDIVTVCLHPDTKAMAWLDEYLFSGFKLHYLAARGVEGPLAALPAPPAR